MPLGGIIRELQVDLDCEVDVFSWITHFGTEYHPGLLICSKIEEDLPVFSQIKNTVAFNGAHFLLIQDLETLSFAEHFHAFNVVQGNNENVSVLNVVNLRFFKPFDLQTTYGFDRYDQYVVPVHVFV